MPSNPKATAERIRNVTEAWQTLRPNKSFAAMNLDDFKARVRPSVAARERIATLEHQLTREMDERDDADAAANEAILKIVNAVKGDPDEGEDSDLYEAMGYVRKSERKSGLSRRKAAPAPPAA